MPVLISESKAQAGCLCDTGVRRAVQRNNGSAMDIKDGDELK